MYNISMSNKKKTKAKKNRKIAKTIKKEKKKIILITSLILGSIFLFFVVVLPILMLIRSIFVGPSLSSYESYLARKYKNETFYFVSGDPSCPWFDSGTCTARFSSKSLKNRSFTVTATKYSSSFSDNYYEIKYGFSLIDFYEKKYGVQLLKKSISNTASPYIMTNIINSSESAIRNSSFDSYDDFLAKLEQLSDNNITIYYTVMDSKLDIYNLSWDFASIESEVSEVIEQNDLKLASVKLIVGNKKIKYTGICPEEFDHTLRGSIELFFTKKDESAADEPDGRSIEGCLRTIYSKD